MIFRDFFDPYLNPIGSGPPICDPVNHVFSRWRSKNRWPPLRELRENSKLCLFRGEFGARCDEEVNFFVLDMVPMKHP